jgi:hypothetical protein
MDGGHFGHSLSISHVEWIGKLPETMLRDALDHLIRYFDQSNTPVASCRRRYSLRIS